MLERAVTLSLLLALSVSGCASTDATGGEPGADEARAATGDDDRAGGAPATADSPPPANGAGPARGRAPVASDLPDMGETSRYFRAHGARTSVDRGHFRGDLLLAGTGVTKEGEGRGETVIDGNVEVRGEGWVLRGMTITGDVTVRGDRNDLSGCEVLGRVDARGAGNVLPAR